MDHRRRSRRREEADTHRVIATDSIVKDQPRPHKRAGRMQLICTLHNNYTITYGLSNGKLEWFDFRNRASPAPVGKSVIYWRLSVAGGGPLGLEADNM